MFGWKGKRSRLPEAQTCRPGRADGRGSACRRDRIVGDARGAAGGEPPLLRLDCVARIPGGTDARLEYPEPDERRRRDQRESVPGSPMKWGTWNSLGTMIPSPALDEQGAALRTEFSVPSARGGD